MKPQRTGIRQRENQQTPTRGSCKTIQLVLGFTCRPGPKEGWIHEVLYSLSRCPVGERALRSMPGNGGGTRCLICTFACKCLLIPMHDPLFGAIFCAFPAVKFMQSRIFGANIVRARRAHVFTALRCWELSGSTALMFLFILPLSWSCWSRSLDFPLLIMMQW